MSDDPDSAFRVEIGRTAPKPNKEPEKKDDPDVALLKQIREDMGDIDNPITTLKSG